MYFSIPEFLQKFIERSFALESIKLSAIIVDQADSLDKNIIGTPTHGCRVELIVKLLVARTASNFCAFFFDAHATVFETKLLSANPNFA